MCLALFLFTHLSLFLSIYLSISLSLSLCMYISKYLSLISSGGQSATTCIIQLGFVCATIEMMIVINKSTLLCVGITNSILSIIHNLSNCYLRTPYQVFRTFYLLRYILPPNVIFDLYNHVHQLLHLS